MGPEWEEGEGVCSLFARGLAGSLQRAFVRSDLGSQTTGHAAWFMLLPHRQPCTLHGWAVCVHLTGASAGSRVAAALAALDFSRAPSTTPGPRRPRRRGTTSTAGVLLRLRRGSSTTSTAAAERRAHVSRTTPRGNVFPACRTLVQCQCVDGSCARRWLNAVA